jgi:hypothetical protein
MSVPSLPCVAARQNAGDKTKEALEFCKDLYRDSRLDPLREVMTFETVPTLSMQSNPRYVTDEQRTALDVLGSLSKGVGTK